MRIAVLAKPEIETNSRAIAARKTAMRHRPFIDSYPKSCFVYANIPHLPGDAEFGIAKYPCGTNCFPHRDQNKWAYHIKIEMKRN